MQSVDRSRLPQPRQIGTGTPTPFSDTFGNKISEDAALVIVLMQQESGKGRDWISFTGSKIDCFLQKLLQEKGQVILRCFNGGGRFAFGRLVSEGWVVARNGNYHLTEEFIRKVYEASPARPLPVSDSTD